MKICGACNRAMAHIADPDGNHWHYCLNCDRPQGDRP